MFNCIQALWVFSLVNYELPTYNNGVYQYPTWAHGIGWGFAAASLGWIPIFAVIAVYRSEGDTLLKVQMIVMLFNYYQSFIIFKSISETAKFNQTKYIRM